MQRLNGLYLGAAILAVGAYAAGCAGEGPDALDVPYDYSSGSGSGEGGSGSGGGDTSSGSSSTQSAEDFFKAEVHSELISQCSSCHGMDQQVGPQWLESTADDAYATIKAFGGLVNAPDCAELITHTKGSHSGVPFTPEFEPTVIQWLQLEASENGLSCGGGGGTEGGALEECEAALDEFASCMSYAYWEVSGASEVPYQNTDSGPCFSCHTTGMGGAHLSEDTLDTFSAHQEDKYFLIKIVRCAISGGEFQGLQPALRYDNKGTEPCNNPSGNCHPDYVLTPERSDGLAMFVDDTYQASMDGTCEALDQQAQDQLNNQ
jgi:hypothetical protein